MKKGRTIFNMKNEDLMKNLSQKLLIAFNESKYHLEYQFICLRCLGISVNPLYCKHCKYSYCENCIQLLPASKIICICKKTSKENFEFQINNELFNTYYFIQDKSSLQKSQISYSEALACHNISTSIFIPSENLQTTTVVIENYNQNCQLTNHQVSRHHTNYLHPFSLKETRLINFNYAKGYSLKLEDKVLCANDGNFLRTIHLAKIELHWCLWSIDFSLSLSKSIRSNKNKLKEIRLDHSFRGEGTNFKSYLIIFNALTFCSKVVYINLSFSYRYVKDKLIPKSFYEFLSNSYILTGISFTGFAFYDYMNFKPFQRLVSLQYLALYTCTFNFNSFEYLYQNNFPVMQKLYLWNNQISNSFSGENIGLADPFLHKSFKFPPILYLDYLVDSSGSLENLLFESLIKSESIKIKSLYIEFSSEWHSKPIPTFSKFLKVSNIQFLSLRNLEYTQGFENGFCEFLGNSQFLYGLDLSFSMKDSFNADLILQALSLNKSIKVLYLRNIRLSNFYLNNLILSSQFITILSLSSSRIQIDLNFINSLSKSKSVLYLYLPYNNINNDDAGKLSELNLKGINVYNTGISKSNEKIIYKKIPKFEAPCDILECEEFLKEKKVN